MPDESAQNKSLQPVDLGFLVGATVSRVYFDPLRIDWWDPDRVQAAQPVRSLAARGCRIACPEAVSQTGTRRKSADSELPQIAALDEGGELLRDLEIGSRGAVEDGLHHAVVVDELHEVNLV